MCGEFRAAIHRSVARCRRSCRSGRWNPRERNILKPYPAAIVLRPLSLHHVSLSKETRRAGEVRFTCSVTGSSIFDQAHFSSLANTWTASAGRISGIMSDFQPERAGGRTVKLGGRDEVLRRTVWAAQYIHPALHPGSARGWGRGSRCVWPDAASGWRASQ